MKRKMRTLFRRLDIDNDGFLTRRDYEGIAERFVQEGKLEGPEAEKVRDNMQKVSYF